MIETSPSKSLAAASALLDMTTNAMESVARPPAIAMEDHAYTVEESRRTTTGKIF
jgi:hypothetical protein